MLEARIAGMIGPTLDDMGYTLVRVRVSGGRSQQIQIMAEHKNLATMTVEDCATISRAISALLDVEDPVAGPYNLEVSSPGLDRPLVCPADYVRFKGLLACLDVTRPVNGRKRFRGRIADADTATVTVETDGGPIELDFGDIAKASLVITDDLLRSVPDRGLS